MLIFNRLTLESEKQDEAECMLASKAYHRRAVNARFPALKCDIFPSFRTAIPCLPKHAQKLPLAHLLHFHITSEDPPIV